MPLGSQLGAELGAPANPAESYAAARPELYFLFLFQLLKYLEAFPPVVGAVIVPGLVMLSLFLMPFIGRWELGHRFNVVWTFALLVGAGCSPRSPGVTITMATTPESQHYLAAVAEAEAKPSGPSSWPARRPAFRRPVRCRCCEAIRKRKARNCSANIARRAIAMSIRRRRTATDSPQMIVVEKPTASNLWGFGTANGLPAFSIPSKSPARTTSATRHSKKATW